MRSLCKVYSTAYPPDTVQWETHVMSEPVEQPPSIILKASWQIAQRQNIEKDVYTALDGTFGTPTCLYCARPLNPQGNPMSNLVFLPKDNEIKSSFWGVLSREAPEDAEKRYLVLTLLATEGESLVHAQEAKDLLM
jgi:hypothetical protein